MDAIEQRMNARISDIEKNIDAKLNSILEALHVHRPGCEVNSTRVTSMKRLKEKLKEAFVNDQINQRAPTDSEKVGMLRWYFGICEPDARKGIVGSRSLQELVPQMDSYDFRPAISTTAVFSICFISAIGIYFYT